MAETLTKNMAETIALQAVAYLLQDDRLLERFVANCGFEPVDFRNRLNEPAFLAAICAYLLEDDASTMDFCRSIDTRPDDLHRAQHMLEQEGFRG